MAHMWGVTPPLILTKQSAEVKATQGSPHGDIGVTAVVSAKAGIPDHAVTLS